MDELFAFLKEKYLEDLVKPLALHKIFIFLFYLLILNLFVEYGFHDSFWVKLGRIKFSEVINPQNKLWQEMTLLHIFFSFVLVGFNSWLSNKIKGGFFALFLSLKSIDEYIGNLKMKLGRNLTDNPNYNLLLLKDLVSDTKEKKNKLKRFHVYSELLIAISLSSCIGLILSKNIIDLFVAVITTFFVIYFQRQAYLYFIKEIVPYLLPEKMLLESDFDLKEEF